jgi:hypothetical protein
VISLQGQQGEVLNDCAGQRIAAGDRKLESWPFA